MADLTPEEMDNVVGDKYALIMLANYVLLKHGPVRLSLHVDDVPAVIGPVWGDRVVDIANRRECTHVAVEVSPDRVHTIFELPN